MPREAFPEIIETKIYVSSINPGNAAEDVEKLIIKPLEEEFNTEIPDEEAEKITTVQQAIDYINANLK